MGYNQVEANMCRCCGEVWNKLSLIEVPLDNEHNLLLCPDCYTALGKKYKSCYIVHIDFDGDIKSKFSWGTWSVYTDYEDVKRVIIEALTDLMRHQHSHDRDAVITINDEVDVAIEDVIAEENLLYAYIHNGGCQMGNWEISIHEAELHIK